MTGDDVLIVGGGVIGCIIARDLAKDHEVCVLERDGIAAGATGLSAGLIAPTLFYADLPAAARCANEFFRDFDGTEHFSFTRRERLDLIAPDDADDARDRADRLADEGFPVSFWETDTIADAYPTLRTSAFAGAVRYGDTGWVDPYSYATALQADAERRGATFEIGTAVTGLLVEDGAVRGVRTDEGNRRASTVIVTAGWRTGAVVAEAIKIPVLPYRTQCVVLDPSRDVSDTLPLVRVGSENVYFRPEHNGDLLVGGGRSLVDDPTRVNPDADEAFRNRVADVIPRLIDGFEDAGVVDGWAGVDGATPDGRPIIDAGGDLSSGLVVATGFNGLGVMSSPIAAAAVRGLVTEDAPPVPLDPFGLDRFETRSLEFDLRSTSDL